MIIDLPTADEFITNGKAFLNLAWETVINLSMGLASYKKYDHINTEDEQKRLEEEYWRHAQHALSVGVALAQQGMEFLLKGQIASVSPYLLIAEEPSKWPSGCDKQDKSFADFKTIDAQELIRLHNTVCPSKLPESFKTEFERLRKLRNTIMHSVEKRVTFSVKDVAVAILEISEWLIGPQSWHSIRKGYFDERDNLFGVYDVNPGVLLAQETLHVVDNLGLLPSELKRFYGFDPKQRRYTCPDCRDSNLYFTATLAQLRPNTPKSRKVYCLSCQETFKVSRKKCHEKGCKGNVIDEEGDTCLTCACC
jgi:hypothetical protein